MPSGTYVGSAGTYSGDAGTYGPAVEQRWIDSYEWGGPFSERYESLWNTSASVVEDAAYQGTYGFKQHDHSTGRTVEDYSLPGMGLDTYPQPGDEFIAAIRLFNIGSNWQAWYLFGGVDGRYPRYQLDFISPDTYRMQVRTNDGRYTVASAAESAQPDPTYANYEDVWLANVWKWYDQGHDGRSGVKSALYQASDIPWGETDFADTDVSFFSAYSTISPITMCDSADHPNDDGTADIPHEPGRWGARTSNEIWHDIDSVALLYRA